MMWTDKEEADFIQAESAPRMMSRADERELAAYRNIGTFVEFALLKAEKEKQHDTTAD